MKYCFFILLSLMLIVSPIQAEEKLIISISAQNIPEGKLTAALAKVLFDRTTGIVYEYVSLPNARSIYELGHGILDIEGPRNPTIEKNFSNIIKIPETIFVNDLVAFSKNSKIKLSGWESLKRYRVAYLTGWKIFENNVTGVKNFEILETPESLFKFLDAERTDIILISRLSGLKVISDLNLEGVAAIEPPLTVKNFYLYINKKHEKLAPVFAKILRNMKSDGTYCQVYRKVIGTDCKLNKFIKQ